MPRGVCLGLVWVWDFLFLFLSLFSSVFECLED